MKKQPTTTRLLRSSTLIGILISILTGVSCMTTYDSAGRPVQSVDPGAAVAGAAAAGVVGYAIGRNNDHHDHYRSGGYYGGGTYYSPRPYYRKYR